MSYVSVDYRAFKFCVFSATLFNPLWLGMGIWHGQIYLFFGKISISFCLWNISSLPVFNCDLCLQIKVNPECPLHYNSQDNISCDMKVFGSQQTYLDSRLRDFHHHIPSLAIVRHNWYRLKTNTTLGWFTAANACAVTSLTFIMVMVAWIMF